MKKLLLSSRGGTEYALPCLGYLNAWTQVHVCKKSERVWEFHRVCMRVWAEARVVGMYWHLKQKIKTERKKMYGKERVGTNMLSTVCVVGAFNVSRNEYAFEGWVDVGVWGLSSVGGIIHWGDGLRAIPRALSLIEEKSKRVLHSTLCHTSSPLTLPLSPSLPSVQCDTSLQFPSLLLLATLMCHSCRGLAPLCHKMSPSCF